MAQASFKRIIFVETTTEYAFPAATDHLTKARIKI
jgi:hypothetical protein